MSENGFVVEDFTAARNAKTLRGFCRIRTAPGLIFHNCSVHEKGGHYWVTPSRAAMLDRSGQQQRDATGRGMWTTVVSFTSIALRDKFSELAVAALRQRYPDALGEQSNPHVSHAAVATESGKHEYERGFAGAATVSP